jgi:glycosyltransferase involved in cell wall biosynthesis
MNASPPQNPSPASVSPRLSVIMPVYNVEKYIVEAMDSVLSQSFRDFELIVVDDGSTDGTGRLIEQQSRVDPRVRVIRQPNSGRPSVPRNRGIAESKGELIVFLDGDDLFLPNRLSAVVDVFDAHPDVDLVLNDLLSYDAEGQSTPRTYLRQFNFPDGARDILKPIGDRVFVVGEELYRYSSAVFCPMLMPTVSLRAARLRREPVWFREDMRCGEDIDLWFRLLIDSRAAYVDQPLAVYRYRSDSTTQDRADFYIGTLRAHEMNIARSGDRLTSAERARYIRRIGDRYQHLGYHYLVHGDPVRARASYRKAFRVKPEWSILVKYAKTFVPQALRRARKTRQSVTSTR